VRHSDQTPLAPPGTLALTLCCPTQMSIKDGHSAGTSLMPRAASPDPAPRLGLHLGQADPKRIPRILLHTVQMPKRLATSQSGGTSPRYLPAACPSRCLLSALGSSHPWALAQLASGQPATGQYSLLCGSGGGSAPLSPPISTSPSWAAATGATATGATTSAGQGKNIDAAFPTGIGGAGGLEGGPRGPEGSGSRTPPAAASGAGGAGAGAGAEGAARPWLPPGPPALDPWELTKSQCPSPPRSCGNAAPPSAALLATAAVKGR
jgi:hypothetical protein